MSESIEDQPGDAVPASQKSTWTQFIKSIANVSGDLSSLTAPPFILSPVSLTEFPAYWCERPDLFATIAEGKTPEDRARRVLKWFISTLKGQYTSRNETMGSEKKPLNPVLGELFYGHWPDRDGRGLTTLVVEQVSHHPPITAYHIANPSRGITLQGHNAQKTSFSGGNIIVKQVGHATLTVSLRDGKKEDYLITLPRLRIEGLWYGSPYIELTESSYIQSSSGWLSTIKYQGKGYFSGKSHSFKADLTPPIGSGSSYRASSFEGQWNTTSKNLRTGAVFTDVTGPKEEVTVGPVDDQTEWESRRLWHKVAKGIRESDFETAAREKGRIENEQRQRRRDEATAGTTWELKHFTHEDDDPLYERLGRLFKLVPPTEDVYVFKNNGPTFEDA
ncbi:Oxysterol-binding protein [Russula earlei]|uniref:Oxysterol-binding protein n=1 Tax=Russula earlei TaxID=71964 RepID=A0ACC0TZX3_9AGAM|nr:Oxysterol-binding protein [Russula earlei]